ncbi:MAG: glycosyltransferase [Bacteroidales bacterium]|nr:glycosyltransferase [Bacteroidales bacterium]
MEIYIFILFLFLIPACITYITLIVFFSRGWYKGLKMGTIEDDPETVLRVSVIIPARNEEDHIKNLLSDLAAQDYPRERCEVIVVDDRSTDRTADLTERFRLMHPGFNLKLIRPDGDASNGSKKRALTIGVHSATGEVILTTDADCRLGPGWITAMAAFFRDRDIALTAGPVTYHDVKGFLNCFQALEFLGMMASGAGAVKAGMPFICNGANLAYRRDTFLELRGFQGNEKYVSGDDVFLMHGIKRKRGKQSICFAFTKDALVKTVPAQNAKVFFRQRIRWASKSKGYQDSTALLTTLTVFFLNLSMVMFFLTGFFHPPAFLVFAGAVLIKSLTDLPLLLGVTQFTDQRRLLRGYLLFQLLYPFYVVTTGILSLLLPVNWKR